MVGQPSNVQQMSTKADTSSPNFGWFGIELRIIDSKTHLKNAIPKIKRERNFMKPIDNFKRILFLNDQVKIKKMDVAFEYKNE